MKSLRFRMNARDSRSKKQSCNNVSNPRKQRQIHTCFTQWEKTRARNGSKHRSLKRDNDSMDLKTEDVGRRSPFWIGSHFPLPDFLIIPRSFTPLFLIPKATRVETHGFGPMLDVHRHPFLCVHGVPFCRWFVLLKFWLHGLCSKTALTAETLRFKQIFRWNNNSYISRNTRMVTNNDVMFFYIGSCCFVFN